ncbi:MAG: AAA domain-containing protein [Desulfobulbaceae bacterium]|nr:AAA domain-containing protein [Desulfobulbaceae bacterium]
MHPSPTAVFPAVPDSPAALAELLAGVIAETGRFVLGKEPQIRLALCSLLAEGHLLIEDITGIGKTTLAKALAGVLGLDFRRIQCTSDMLPGDILGVSVFEQASASFSFHPGPIFTRILLADEINRTTPKTQSALLEAMEERQVTLEGATRPLPAPFFVIATQNPLEQAGTYPLPESQLDRFLFRLTLGYPDREAERQLLSGDSEPVADITPLLDADRVLQLQLRARGVHLSTHLVGYVQDLLEVSRLSGRFAFGLSPRAGLALLRAARAWAVLAGRDWVLPEDVQQVLPHVAGHRLRHADTLVEFNPAELATVFQGVPVPA